MRSIQYLSSSSTITTTRGSSSQTKTLPSALIHSRRMGTILIRNCSLFLLLLLLGGDIRQQSGSSSTNLMVLAYTTTHSLARYCRDIHRRSLQSSSSSSSSSFSSHFRWKLTNTAESTRLSSDATHNNMLSMTSSSSSDIVHCPSSSNQQEHQLNTQPASSSPSSHPRLVTSRRPHPLANGRGTFLGFRNVKDLERQSNHLQHLLNSILPSGTTTTSTTTALQSSVQALMPDGGLSPCVIRVLGVGGGGCNAVDRMLESAVGGVEYWAINTDAQALGRSKALGAKVLNIGASVTRGLGAGGDPEVGRMAAEESREDIAAMIQGTDLCFVTSGMGGGTGSGAAPVVSEIAKESGALTIAIVTKPFAFEGRRRMRQATDAINKLRQHVDTVIVVSNNKLLEIIPDDTPVTAAFRVADDILRQGVVGISEIIVRPGLINVDFADVRSIMKDAGTALMGIGTGVGKTSAEDAAIAAISSPLLDEPVQDATGVVFNILGPRNLSLQEVNRAARVIYENVHEDANVIFGALVDDEIQDEVSITVLATGFGGPPPPPPTTATTSSSKSSFGSISRSSSSTSSSRGSVDFPDFLSDRK